MAAFRPLPHLGRSLALALCLALVGLSRAGADDGPKTDDTLPKVFEKDVPASVEDLRAIQNHVKKVLEKAIPATVGLRIGASQGSGVIINKEGIVLTAGHVSGKPGQKVKIILHDGKEVEGETLGGNRGIDSGMIKITAKGDWPHVEMGNSADLKKGGWCLAVGHPRGFQKGRTPVVRLGRVLDNTKALIRSDCALVGGDSGGPLFDMTGKVIGIHSRIGKELASNIHVPVDTYRETWDRLAKAEVWGDGLFGKKTGAFLGVDPHKEASNCRVGGVKENSPAAQAGLRVDDVITMFAGRRVNSFQDLQVMLRFQNPGTEVALQIQRGDETLELKLKLARRPAEKSGL
jgi:serine protease Do